MALSEIAQLAHKNKERFFDVFKRSLFLYFDPLMGFDVVKLDDDLGVPDGTSMKDFVQEHYGDDGVAIIEALIHVHDWQPVYGGHKFEWCQCGARMLDGVLQPVQAG